MYKISNKVIKSSRKLWKIGKLYYQQEDKSLQKWKSRDIFQGDSRLLLLFVIAIKSLNYILKKCAVSYKFTKSQEKINYLMYMDDIKVIAKDEKELDTLIQTIRIYSPDIGMGFGIEKCAKLENEKRETTEGIELLHHKSIRKCGEKENYKYLRILEVGHEMKEEIKIQ